MKTRFLTGLLFLFSVALHAQLNRGGVPWSFYLDTGTPHNVDIVLPPPDLDLIAAEDLLSPIPYRFAVNLPVNVGISMPKKDSDTRYEMRDYQHESDTCETHIANLISRITNPGTWITLPSGDRIWLFTIQAPGAKAITVYFDRFYIPSGGRLFLYNSDRSKLLGAFTDLNNNKDSTFSTALISGEQITLEYDQPASTSTMPDLYISEIAYAYRGVPEFTDRTGFGASGPCEVNIHCEEGDHWQEQQKGVARIAAKKLGSTYWCSGSLINNTRQDKTPYFLTADHCGKSTKPSDFNQWIFYFNYDSPTCSNPSIEPGFRSMTGAEVKSSAGDLNVGGSDFLLLLLNNAVPDTFDVWFNGWNREDISSPSGVGIHHPMGDIKKISTYTMPLISDSWVSIPEKTHWKVKWAATTNGHGVTEGGSSGSPLFDPGGRVVGTLTGGESLCDSGSLNSPDYYGKFSYSWDMNGTETAKRLDFWLDPDNTGVMVLDGIPLNISEPEVQSSDLKLFPNPVSGILHLNSTLLKNQGPIRIDLLDSWGRKVASFTKIIDNSGHLTVDLSSFPNGFYLINISSAELSLTGRIIKL